MEFPLIGCLSSVDARDLRLGPIRKVARILLFRTIRRRNYGHFRRLASSLLPHDPMAIELRCDKPDFAMYADAATPTRILAAVVLPIPEFRYSRALDTAFSEAIDPSWGETFMVQPIYMG